MKAKFIGKRIRGRAVGSVYLEINGEYVEIERVTDMSFLAGSKDIGKIELLVDFTEIKIEG